MGRQQRESTPGSSPHRKRQRINGDRYVLGSYPASDSLACALSHPHCACIGTDLNQVYPHKVRPGLASQL